VEQSSANENTRKEIEIGPFQNEEMMDDIPIIKTSIEKLSLELKQVKLMKVMMKYSFQTYKNYMFRDCSKSLKEEMPFVGISM